MNKLEIITKEFNRVRDIPYRIALSPNEASDDCLAKAERLLKIFRDHNYEVRYRVCKIKWSDLNLPKNVTEKKHDDNCSHVYLEAKIFGEWKIVDATWDQGLKKILPVNEWNSRLDDKLAIPCREYLTPGESLEHIKKITTKKAIELDLKENGEFYKALNEWLEKVRE